MLDRILADAREREYKGWDYGDGMSSRLRRALPVEHRWLNIGFQEVVKRAPLNVRPLLLVEQRRNYQGAALFAMANLTVDRLFDGPSQSVDYREQARTLADWLVHNRSRGYAGYCAGYPHPIQHLDGRGRPHEPDAVNTSFGVKALVRAAVLDERYPTAVRSVSDFVTEDLDYRPVESGRGAIIDYHTKHPQDYYTINAGALCARALVDLHAHFADPELAEMARGLLDHMADLQTDLGGWCYRDPPEASHLSMDNHHNGFIIESFQRYEAVVGDGRYEETLARALSFYRDVLFEPSGAPNFEEYNAFPRDVRASAQGALVFTYAGNLAFARRVLGWAFENLHAGGGRFYSRRHRLHTKRHVLMRWCQASMAFATSEYLRSRVRPDR
jgi:hypothetical protein